MDMKRALEILKAYACCSSTTLNNKLCEECPCNGTKDCENTVINEEVIVEVMNVLRGD